MTRADEFWNWSLAAYERHDARQALLMLQDRHGYVVNTVLWCGWLAEMGYDLRDEDFRHAIGRILQIDQCAVQPLRSARRFLTTPQPGVPEAAQKTARSDVLSTELAMERFVQTTLVDALPRDVQPTSPKESVAARSHRYFTVCGEYLESPRILADERGPEGARALFDDFLRAADIGKDNA